MVQSARHSRPLIHSSSPTNAPVRGGGRWLRAAAAVLLIIGLSHPSPSSHAAPPTADPTAAGKSHVLEIYGEYAVRGMKVHHASVKSLIRRGVTELAGTDDLNNAWRHYVHDNDIIAIKFTSIGGKALGVNKAFAASLLEVLYEAGFRRENIMLVGLDELPEQALGTRPHHYGWQSELVDFGSARDQLASWINDVTAIINVPSIMDDNVLGLRGALANLTWPLLKHPARYYLNGGDPFIPDIYALPQIQGKVRLHIANGLRILYAGGPVVHQRYVHERGSILVSADPVAIDRVALERIRRARDLNPMPDEDIQTLNAPYLQTAFAMGLGHHDLNFIRYQYIRQDKW